MELFDVVDLSEDQLVGIWQCKEEQVSDEEFPAGIDEVNNERTCYPNECSLDEWNQRKGKRNESKETLKQGLCKP